MFLEKSYFSLSDYLENIMMKLTKSLFLLTLIIGVTGCRGLILTWSSPPVITIYNRSNQDVRMLANFNYPDTSVERSRGITSRMSPDLKWPGSGLDRNHWGAKIKKAGKVTLFFMPETLLDEHGEDEAKKHFKPIEKLILSLEDIEKANWEIYYPYELNKTFKAVPHP